MKRLAVSFVSFLLLVFALWYYLINAKQVRDHFVIIDNNIEKISFLDKDFNLYIQKSIAYDNFDIIQARIQKLQKILNILDEQIKYELKSNELEHSLEIVIKTFNAKLKSINLIKSKKAILNNSYRIIQTINIHKFKNDEIHKLFKTILTLDKNPSINIPKELEKLKHIKYTPNKYIKYFLLHSKIILQNELAISNEKDIIDNLDIDNKLSIFHKIYKNVSEKQINNVDMVIKLVFVFLMIAAIFYFIDKYKIILSNKDLSEKERLLYHQSKMASMGEMIENIAHQWRQPLSLVSTISTGLTTQKELGIDIPIEQEKEQLTQINNTVQFLSHTIDDFRNFFSKDKVRSSLNLKETYEQTLSFVKHKFGKLDIKIIENTNNVEITSLNNEIIQVIINILNNAKDALETSQNEIKLISIEIYEKNDFAFLTIHDNAGGVPKNIIDKIFDPYFTTKHKSQGTGIGLYMSEEIITKHIQGLLTVENKKINYNSIEYLGAKFTIKIPIKL